MLLVQTPTLPVLMVEHRQPTLVRGVDQVIRLVGLDVESVAEAAASAGAVVAVVVEDQPFGGPQQWGRWWVMSPDKVESWLGLWS